MTTCPALSPFCPTTLHGGVNNFGAAFLPSSHQGVPLGAPGYPNTLAKDAKFNYMTNDSLSPRQQKLQLELLRKLHERNQSNSAINEALEARIQSFELAFRMQTQAPEVDRSLRRI